MLIKPYACKYICNLTFFVIACSFTCQNAYGFSYVYKRNTLHKQLTNKVQTKLFSSKFLIQTARVTGQQNDKSLVSDNFYI